MFYIKHLTMYKVHMHAGAIRKLLYGCVYVREIIGGAGLLLRTGGPNNWVNIDIEYSIIVINVSRV